MRMNVTFWFVPWAVVTTAVLVLLVWRLVTAERETIGIAPDKPSVTEQEVKLTAKLARIDFWGKALTGVSVALLLMMGATSLYNTLP
jgi:hypothetical protein